MRETSQDPSLLTYCESAACSKHVCSTTHSLLKSLCSQSIVRHILHIRHFLNFVHSVAEWPCRRNPSHSCIPEGEIHPGRYCGLVPTVAALTALGLRVLAACLRREGAWPTPGVQSTRVRASERGVPYLLRQYTDSRFVTFVSIT